MSILQRIPFCNQHGAAVLPTLEGRDLPIGLDVALLARVSEVPFTAARWRGEEKWVAGASLGSNAKRVGGGVTGRNLFSILCRAGCAQDHRGRGDCGYYCVTPCFGLLAEALPHHSILSFWKDQPVCQRFPQIWATFFLAPPPAAGWGGWE